ncbi:MAG TPA: PRC-barrel domain-containing protein [Phycisphaerales bacterium]|nr:PRC-barrel domain-containing protein [Phycisphaerales bacterium]
MKSSKLKMFCLLPTTTMLIVTIASAQNSNPNNPSKNPNSSQDHRQNQNDNYNDNHADASHGTHSTRSMSAPVLIPGDAAKDMNVVDQAGVKIGEIEDLLIGARANRVEYVVMEVKSGSWNSPSIVVPYSAFDWNNQQQHPSLNMTMDQLKNAPKFDSDKWSTLLEDQPRQHLFNYYHVDDTNWRRHADGWTNTDATAGNTQNGGSTATGVGNDASRTTDTSTKNSDKERPNRTSLIRWSDIDNHDLMTNDAQKLGTVDDVIFDCTSGRVSLAVVSFGGFLGMGDTEVTMPWNDIRINPENHLYAVNVDPETLKSAPKYEAKNWKSLREGDYYSRVFNHYGMDTTWLNEGDGMDADRMSGTRNSNGHTNRTPDSTGAMKQFSAQGTISDVTPSAGGNIPSETIISFKTDEGKSVMVLLGSQTNLDKQGVVLTNGTRCTISGSWIEQSGKQFVRATSITTDEGKVVPLHNN